MFNNTKTAVLLVAYGTPDSAKKSDVKRYLKQMLDNHRVVSISGFKRHLLVNCIIAPFRAKRSSALYKKLEDGRGMPLRYHTQDLVDKLAEILKPIADVFYCMTAGNPSVDEVCEHIFSAQYGRLAVIPLFPHFTESTAGNAIGQVLENISPRFNMPEIVTLNTFFNHPLYLDSMAEIINRTLDGFDCQHIVFSYHGIPIKHANLAHGGKSCQEMGCENHYTPENSKCYVSQCYESTRLLAQRIGFDFEKTSTGFQSRFADHWVSPYTDKVVENLVKQGIKRVCVVTPSFTADCLETTIEISQTLRNDFIAWGGQEIRVVPCLNSENIWIQSLAKIIMEKL